MEYKVKTLQDIAEIPDEHLDEFLGDLKAWHKQQSDLKKMGIVLLVREITFIPDGKGDVRLNIKEVE